MGSVLGVILSLVIVLPLLFALPLPFMLKIAILIAVIVYSLVDLCSILGKVSPKITLWKSIALSFIVAVLIAVDFGILEASLGEFLSSWMIYVLFILGLILIWLYLAGGPGIIYIFTIFVLTFGYVMAGPYSGYVKQALWGISEPISIGVKSLESASHDLWLLMTNPQEYIREQQMKQVRTETPAAYPRGAEFVSINLLPDYVPSNRSFYIQVRVENKGPVDLKHLSLIATPRDRCYGSEFNFLKESLRVGEQVIQEFGPFVAAAEKQQDIGRRSEVELTLHYCHEASSNLLVTVMNESEIWKRISNREMSFRLEIATAKATPAMIAMSVGEQPLIAERETTLLVSIVNKRPDGKVKLVKGSTLSLTLPSDLLEVVDPTTPCIPSTQTKKVSCSISASTINCVWEEGETIEPGKYTSITCKLRTLPVEISKSGSVTATLNGYLFELHQKVGPTIAQSNEFRKSGKEGIISLGKACYLCYSGFCGIWESDTCTRDRCHSLGECIYDASTKNCTPCTEITLCEDYPDEEECKDDICGIGICAWNGTACETCFETRGGALEDSRGNMRDAVFSKYLPEYDGNTTVYDYYYGEVYERELNFAGCAYDEARMCMPFEELGESYSREKSYVKCCNAAKCMKLSGYPDSTFIFSFTGLDENGKCWYNVSEKNRAAECYNVNQTCKDSRTISLEVVQKTGLINSATFEDYKNTAATCCIKEFCSHDRDAYYYLTSIDNSAIENWYNLGELGSKETPDGLLIYNSERTNYPIYLVKVGGLCTYVKRACESDEQCYGGGAWAGCCRPEKCEGNAVYKIDETRLSQDAKIKSTIDCDDYYVLKEQCEANETCVENEDGTAQCELTSQNTSS